MTSLAYIFTIEKAIVEIIFSRKFSICQLIYKLFVDLFTTFGMQKVGNYHILLEVFHAKRQFSKDGVRRVHVVHY